METLDTDERLSSPLKPERAEVRELGREVSDSSGNEMADEKGETGVVATVLEVIEVLEIIENSSSSLSESMTCCATVRVRG